MTATSALIHVFRWEPGLDVPWYADYQIPLEGTLTVIRALFHLAAHAADPPAFRRFMCNRGQCAGCVMTIDGRTRRACTTPVRDDMIIDPLHDYPVIKDLVVDFGRKGPDGRTAGLGLRDCYVVRSRPARHEWPSVRVEVKRELCEGCTEKPCIRSCWVNRIEHLEDARGRRLEPVDGPLRLSDGRADLAGVCRNCDDAPCLQKCPAQALRRIAGLGGLSIDPKRCIGCGLCLTACPHDRIWLNLERGHAVKCDLCGGNPECVRACPHQAIRIELGT